MGLVVLALLALNTFDEPFVNEPPFFDSFCFEKGLWDECEATSITSR